MNTLPTVFGTRLLAFWSVPPKFEIREQVYRGVETRTSIGISPSPSSVLDSWQIRLPSPAAGSDRSPASCNLHEMPRFHTFRPATHVSAVSGREVRFPGACCQLRHSRSDGLCCTSLRRGRHFVSACLSHVAPALEVNAALAPVVGCIRPALIVSWCRSSSSGVYVAHASDVAHVFSNTTVCAAPVHAASA